MFDKIKGVLRTMGDGLEKAIHGAHYAPVQACLQEHSYELTQTGSEITLALFDIDVGGAQGQLWMYDTNGDGNLERVVRYPNADGSGDSHTIGNAAIAEEQFGHIFRDAVTWATEAERDRMKNFFANYDPAQDRLNDTPRGSLVDFLLQTYLNPADVGDEGYEWNIVMTSDGKLRRLISKYREVTDTGITSKQLIDWSFQAKGSALFPEKRLLEAEFANSLATVGF